jgi:hypothetical protein
VDTEHTIYYTGQRKKMMRGFERMIACARQPSLRVLNIGQFEVAHHKARKEYERLIPLLPYIGGKKNPGTTNLIGGAQLLSIVWGLESQGLSREQIGEIIYGTWEQFFNRIPKWVGKLMGKLMTTEAYLKKRRDIALESQKREYSEAFVNELVTTKDGSFLYGQDTLECAICKLYKKYDALQYMPYICLGGYPLFRRIGVGFFRTKTLGHGDDRCDFRFTKDEMTLPGWPPENLQEWKG